MASVVATTALHGNGLLHVLMDPTKCEDFKSPRGELTGLLPPDCGEFCSANQQKAPIAHPIRNIWITNRKWRSCAALRPLPQCV